MEGSSAQVQNLHKKFEELNEEISSALRQQQDVVNANSSAPSKREVLRFTKKTTEWRADVSALAKQIDHQLQHSRALRSQEAHSMLKTSVANQKQFDEDKSSTLRSLRSDLRLLLDFRLGYMRSKSMKDPTVEATFHDMADQETVRDLALYSHEISVT